LRANAFELFLLPVNIVAELRLKPLDVKAEHAVDAELAKFARIAGAERVFLLAAEIVAAHDLFKILERSLIDGFVDFEIEEKPTEMIATHDASDTLWLIREIRASN
jgi:hypothetical protein